MTRDEEIRHVIIETLTRIAPEVGAGSILPDVEFREQLDLDSMDFLNFILALHDRLGVEIPEADYPKLSTLERAIHYLSGKVR
jgi:acyl carrier protein